MMEQRSENELGHFLILEDDAVFAQTLMRSLQRRGYSVNHCADGASALLAAQQTLFDYITVDMHLAQDSGLQWLAQLRACQPQASILVLTGYASIATTVTAIKAGADNYLPKPANVDVILAALQVGAGAEEGTDESAELAETPLSAEAMSVRRLEWEHIQRVLQEHDGNISSAARALHMHRRTLQRKLGKKPMAK